MVEIIYKLTEAGIRHVFTAPNRERALQCAAGWLRSKGQVPRVALVSFEAGKLGFRQETDCLEDLKLEMRKVG